MQNKILDRTNFDFANSAIIKPPFEEPKNKEVSHKYTRVVIDSRDRDLSVYPTPTKYVISLDQDIEEVKTGEIVLMDVPLSGYIVNKFNNVIKIDDVTVSLPLGNYDGPGLAHIISTSVPNITCTYSVVINKLVFDSPSPCTIYFGKDNVSIATARLLGFNPDSETQIPCTAPNCINLNVNNYVVMSIEAFSINSSSNTVLDRTTAIVHPRASLLNFWSVNNQIKKYFNPIIPRLTRLKVSFTDYYGNPYDFNNVDHRIEILFESRKQLSRYSQFV